MQRFSEIAAFPLIAGALGAAAAFLADAAGAGTAAAVALGAALFAAAIALRNFTQAETDRPLLAEELGGVHERLDALQDEAADLRELLTDLASIVEEAATREQTAMEAISGRLARLEQARLTDPDTLQLATMESIQEVVGPIADRLERFDARTRKLALAIEKGFGESQETAAASRAAFGAQPDEAPAAPAETVAADASKPAPGAPRFDEDARDLGRRYALMMQAVFSVPDGEPRFFEAYTRRIGADGQIAATADHIPGAKAAGRMGEVDNLLLVRCVAAAEQLRSGGRDVAVFCNLSILSLRDPAYLRSFIGFLRKNTPLSRHLVFEFSQVELDDFCDADIDILQRLRETGFVFSIDHLEDWSIDIGNLAKIGFRYVKLDAATLLEREERSAGAVARLARSFERVGLSLIVEKVESVEDAQKLEAAGARFLQGQGLAEPRLIRVDDQTFADLEDSARRAMASGGGLKEPRGGAEGSARESSARKDALDDGDGPGGRGQAGASAEGASARGKREASGEDRPFRAERDALERAIEAVGRGLSGSPWSGGGAPTHRRPD